MNTFNYIKEDAVITIDVGGDIKSLTKSEFISLMNKNNLSISSAGVIYEKNKRGLLADILDVWYEDRQKFQTKMKEASNNNDAVSERFYDKRQLVQKILLNSLYGVLGLESFRFYDLDNALSVTLTGQDIIKSSSMKINQYYIQTLLDNGADESVKHNDYVTYVDTDSNYMSNEPLIKLLNITDAEKSKSLTIKIANETVEVVNSFYDNLMTMCFNCEDHVIKTAGETVGITGIWIAKKRYCIHKIYDLEKCKNVDKFHIKGLDVVRSSFPTKFKEFMLNAEEKTGVISDFLLKTPKRIVDDKIIEFKRKLSSFDVVDIARNTGIKDIAKFEKHCKDAVMGEFPKIVEDGKTKGYPAHVKAAITFNKFIKHHGLDKNVEPITNGEKIKYVYVKRNFLGIEEIAFRGYHDPKELTEFIDTYADGRLLYEKEMAKKLDDFYDALKWDYPSEGAVIIDTFFGDDDEEGAKTVKLDKTKKEPKPKLKKTESADEFFSF